MPAAPPPPPVDATLAARNLQQVFFLANELEREIARLLRIGPTDYRALSALMQAGSLTVGELARAIGATYATTTALANRLEAAGRVHRVRSDRDQRKVHLSVADATAAEILGLMNPPMERARGYLEGLSPEERSTVAAFTADLAGSLHEHLRSLSDTPADRPAAPLSTDPKERP